MSTTSSISPSSSPILPTASGLDREAIADQLTPPATEQSSSESISALNAVWKGVSALVSSFFPPFATVVAAINGIFGSGG